MRIIFVIWPHRCHTWGGGGDALKLIASIETPLASSFPVMIVANDIHGSQLPKGPPTRSHDTLLSKVSLQPAVETESRTDRPCREKIEPNPRQLSRADRFCYSGLIQNQCAYLPPYHRARTQRDTMSPAFVQAPQFFCPSFLASIWLQVNPCGETWLRCQRPTRAGSMSEVSASCLVGALSQVRPSQGRPGPRECLEITRTDPQSTTCGELVRLVRTPDTCCFLILIAGNPVGGILYVLKKP